jgi:hypothetical protein
MEVLESPVPYIIGVQRLEKEQLKTAGECLVIDCNNRTVSLPAHFPQLPIETKLYVHTPHCSIQPGHPYYYMCEVVAHSISS